MLEFVSGGDLRDLLWNQRHSIELSWDTNLLDMAMDVMEALVYLHHWFPPLIHRDLKSRNILVDTASLSCKLSDFGLSRHRSLGTSMTLGVGTLRWTAPELIIGTKYSEAVDIYSFGVVLTELDTRKLPFPDFRGNCEMTLAYEVARQKRRPEFSENAPVELVTLGRACMEHDPQLRPSALQVLQQLKAMKRIFASSHS